MHTFECDACDLNLASPDADALANEVVRHRDYHALNNEFHEEALASNPCVSAQSDEGNHSHTHQNEEGALTMIPQNTNASEYNVEDLASDPVTYEERKRGADNARRIAAEMQRGGFATFGEWADSMNKPTDSTPLQFRRDNDAILDAAEYREDL